MWHLLPNSGHVEFETQESEFGTVHCAVLPHDAICNGLMQTNNIHKRDWGAKTSVNATGQMLSISVVSISLLPSLRKVTLIFELVIRIILF
ncbi:hypothetical protein C8J35_10617 [Rhizobium sp. PP-F2F-G38]|nr:hypothetical protein C8J35_10617 [Rhizobium sp. PP-F2F-G38]